MKRFVWRLQRVLDIKIKEEQARRSELLELIKKLTQERGELLTQQRILEGIIAGIASKNPRKRLSEQEFFLRHSAASDRQMKKLRSKIAELESQQREKVAELLKARRFKETLEKLRDEAKMRYMKSAEKLEQKEMDESATIDFARRKMQGEKISVSEGEKG